MVGVAGDVADHQAGGVGGVITDFILGILNSMLGGFVGLLPEWEVSIPGPGGLGSWLSDLNKLFPLGELAGVALAILALGVPFLAATLSLWVLALVRGGSSRG